MSDFCEFQCQHCHKLLKAKPEDKGKRCRCTSCGSLTEVGAFDHPKHHRSSIVAILAVVTVVAAVIFAAAIVVNHEYQKHLAAFAEKNQEKLPAEDKHLDTENDPEKVENPRADIRLGDRLVSIKKRSDEPKYSFLHKADDMNRLLLGAVGDKVTVRIRDGSDDLLVDTDIVYGKKYDEGKYIELMRRKNGYVTQIPREVLERFPGSNRSYEYVDNQSKIQAFPSKYDGKRIAVLTETLFPEVESGKLSIRLFHNIDSPKGMVEQRQRPRLFEKIVENDPKKDQFLIMHVRLTMYVDVRMLYGEIEEVMFVDQEKGKDLYKPLSDEEEWPGEYREKSYPYICEIRRGGPAEKLGIKVGDIYLKYGGVDLVKCFNHNDTFASVPKV